MRNSQPTPLDGSLAIARRRFLASMATSTAALGTLLARDGRLSLGQEPAFEPETGTGAALSELHHAPRAKRMIYLFQSGAPSQMDLFDPKPTMVDYFDQDLPDEIRRGQRLTTMTSGQQRFPIAPSKYEFEQCGESGLWLSELLPFTKEIADRLCMIRSMYTEAINHDPAMTFFQTGSQIAGRPSMGSWLSYGLGSMNDDLPTYVALSSRGSGRPSCQPLYDRLWGSGFLPTVHQGVKLRGQGDPVLFLSNPAGMDATLRRQMLDDLARVNQMRREEWGDPEIDTRIAQYELAFRMQTSVPELVDFSDETPETLERYGPEVTKRGSYAYNCLLARRLAERGVRFVQLFHMGWDQHFQLPVQLPGQCRDTDQPTTALIKDLAERGLLDDTIVVWGGEFGRTIYCQGALTKDNYGRDHHPRCFSLWATGGGFRQGMTWGKTDEFSYNIVENPLHVHDLHATLLHQLGIDHTRLTYQYQGRHFRLTDVHGQVVRELLDQA